jgi:coenzyme F420 hydrogenase subunit beta
MAPEEKKQRKLFAHLTRDVSLDLCLNCGACVASCPTNALELIDGRVSLKGRCIACGICYEQCPQLVSDAELAKKVFGREPDPNGIGVYDEAYSARTTSPDISPVGQDGGVVTEMLASLLDAGFIDGAVVMGIGEAPWLPQPRVARTRQELLECAGSKYAPGSILLGLRDAIDLHSCERIAVVGSPCQIKAIRRMQTSSLMPRRITDPIKLSVGLFCSKAFPYERFFKKVIEDQLGINLAEVAKFDIDKGNFIIYRKGKPKRELAVDSLGQFAYLPCKVCLDFAAELADISVGGVGSPAGHSTVLIRTQVGKEAFVQARKGHKLEVTPLEEVKPGIKAVEKVSAKKKRASKGEIGRRKKRGEPLPPWLREESG